jgi:hypothetical protein
MMSWSRCSGQIVDYDESFHVQDLAYFPIVEYRIDGEVIRFKSGGGVFPKPKELKQVVVMIDPKGEQTCILSFRSIIGTTLIPFIIGALLILLGYYSKE